MLLSFYSHYIPINIMKNDLRILNGCKSFDKIGPIPCGDVSVCSAIWGILSHQNGEL